jgi:hypothetical protein
MTMSLDRIIFILTLAVAMLLFGLLITNSFPTAAHTQHRAQFSSAQPHLAI